MYVLPARGDVWLVRYIFNTRRIYASVDGGEPRAFSIVLCCGFDCLCASDGGESAMKDTNPFKRETL